MRQEYKLAEVKHSGRKGIRGTDVTELNYEGLVGSHVWCDFDAIKQFEPMEWSFSDHPNYDWWTTSEVLEAAYDPDIHTYIVETANTIYVFKEMNYGETKSE